MKSLRAFPLAILALLVSLTIAITSCGAPGDKEQPGGEKTKGKESKGIEDKKGPEEKPSTSGGVAAVGLAPGDLTLDITVDETPQPAVLTSAIERDLTLKLTRSAEKGFKGSILLGTPRGIESNAKPQVFAFDLSDSKSASFSTKVTVPEGLGVVELSYPVKVTVDGKTYMTMDFLVTKGLAWKIIGPFEGGPETAHDKPYPPEETIDLKATYTGKGGKSVSWKTFPANAIHDDGLYELNVAYTDNDYATAYATIDVFSPKEMKAKLELGSDDSLKAWLNGEIVDDNNTLRGASPAQDVVDITLKKGTNTFLLKVCEADGGWGYYFNITGEDGKPIDGLKNSVSVARSYIMDPVFRGTEVTRTTASFKWRSDVPNVPDLIVQKAMQGRAPSYPGPLPRSDMVKPDPGAEPVIVPTTQYSMDHTATVEGLEPGTRYIAYAEPAVGGEPSEPYSFYTAAPKGKTQVLDLHIICMVFTNVTYDDSVDREGAKTPISDSEIDRLKWQLKQTELFYYVNSGMRMNPRIDYIVEDGNYVIGEEDIYAVAFNEVNENEKLYYEVLKKNGKKSSDYDGVMLVSYSKKWDPHMNGGAGGWTYFHGGGGTVGPMPATGLGKCGWRAGTDSHDGWLMCHEFQHQLDALYHESMGPEHLFCHFAPMLDTAFRHGEHWDGIAWIFREWAGYLSREHQGFPLLEPTLGFRYFTNRWGTVIEYTDKDNDGIPDDAPELPLDEKRLGSDPAKVDTDGDGLSDMMEVMACNWVEYGLGATWAGDKKTHYCDPTRVDSDGDGIKDGVDPYPIYPIDPRIKKAPNATGEIAAKDLKQFVTVDDKVFKGSYSLSWNDDYLSVGIEAPKKPRRFRVCLDMDDNGWYFGADNYDMEIFPDGIGRHGPEWYGNEERTFIDGFHNCGVKDKWPFYDGKGLTDGEIKYTQKVGEDGSYTGQILIPRNEANGLKLVEGEKIGVLLTIDPEGGVQRPMDFNRGISVFEPHTFFAFELAK